MTALLALALQATAAIAPAPPPMPPADWTALPDLPLPPNRIAFDPSGYVRREVAAGRCRASEDGAAKQVSASVAVLLDAEGGVQRVVPRAIDCPTVEQFTAGYVSALARRMGPDAALKAGWYRYTVTYRWDG